MQTAQIVSAVISISFVISIVASVIIYYLSDICHALNLPVPSAETISKSFAISALSPVMFGVSVSIAVITTTTALAVCGSAITMIYFVDSVSKIVM